MQTPATFLPDVRGTACLCSAAVRLRVAPRLLQHVSEAGKAPASSVAGKQKHGQSGRRFQGTCKRRSLGAHAVHAVRALQMYMVYVSLLLGALNKLPLKLPRRGVGRRRANSGNASLAQAAITFDDVAGVDEAKEELAEIVVRCALLRRLFRL